MIDIPELGRIAGLQADCEEIRASRAICQ